MTEKNEATGSINATPDGPYHVQDVKELRNHKGELVSSEPEMWLCRCGRSSNKPYCDSSHVKAGFSGQNECDRSRNAFKDYAGEELVVHDNRWICAHAEHCVKEAPGAFQRGRRPWIQPDGDPPEVVKQVISRCPSGALAYSQDGVRHEEGERPPALRMCKDGPYEVVGGPELCGQVETPPVCAEHYALCRCGHSRNKPYCDGTHSRVGFADEKN